MRLLAVLVLLAATVACAAEREPPAGSPYGHLRGRLLGSGATFPKSFYDEAIAELAVLAPRLTIEYSGGGSGRGRSDLRGGLVDFAGSDSLLSAEDLSSAGGEILYVPTVVAPITLSFNLPGVGHLQLTPATVAGIFQRDITSWDDAALVADNPSVVLPPRDIVVVRRADGSGTTDNFSKFLEASAGPAAGGPWRLGSGSELEWPAGTTAGDGNSGVAQIVHDTTGAIGYVDYSDALAAGFTVAAVRNRDGVFVLPTLDATTAAVANVEVAADLTFSSTWAPGAGSYPIAAQTWILVRAEQPDEATAQRVRGVLVYMLTEGQQRATSIDYAPLPEPLRLAALANVARVGA